jgi:hypothetical protein
MKDDIKHILWLLGKSLKALILFELATAREAFFCIYIHLTYEHELIEEEQEPLSSENHEIL